jgi:DNA-binding NtrC family response regulator
VINLKGKRILVVEDEPMMREAIASYFMLMGANVSSAENGTIAFEMVKVEEFDAVLTDVHMPGGDGLTLIKNIADSIISVKPKIFVCSGFNDLTQNEAIKYGIVAIFEKPFDRKYLLTTISNALLK